MSYAKKLGWSGAAALFAVVFTLGLLAQQALAAVTVPTPATTAVSRASAGGVYTGMADIMLAGNAVGDFIAGTCVFTAPAGWEFNPASSPVVVSTAAGITQGAPSVVTATTITITLAGVQTGVGSVTVDLTDAVGDVRPITTATVDGAVEITLTTCAPSLAAGTDVQFLDIQAVAPYQCVLGSSVGSLPANGSENATLTVTVTDATGTAVANVPVSWTVSQGVLGTGTSKTATSFTGGTGTTTQNYRGAGNVATTDTIIASNSTFNMVCTLSMPLTAAGGTTASTIVILPPSQSTLAADITNVSPNYQSPDECANFAVHVRDSAGLGVNNQTVLVTTNKGAVAQGFDVAPGFTAKAFTATTASLASSPGGEVRPGIIQGTICALQTDAPGQATITAQNISTSMTNATANVMMAGRPAELVATATGNSISVLVRDADDNPVADGTPVRFTISSETGAVSPLCVTTTNGRANAVVALNAATGTVIVSTDWNETGVASTCALPGGQQLATSVAVGGGGTTPPPGQTCTQGTIISGSIPRNGGFGLIVYCGGTVQQLVTATGCPVATMALWYTVGGNFVIYVPGTTITAVNADFFATFPGGNIPANTPFIGKCV